MKYVAWLVLIVIVVGILVYLSSDELDQVRMIPSSGYIESGSKFGIEIGMPAGDARQRLANRGLNRIAVADLSVSPRTCLGHSYEAGQDVEAWADDGGWEGGIICLAAKDDKIVNIRWMFDIETW